MGFLLLEGGAEFGGDMREPDLKAIELAGGFDAPIRILPTAAAPITTISGQGIMAFDGSSAWAPGMFYRFLSLTGQARTTKKTPGHSGLQS